jgi:hypothetical protein
MPCMERVVASLHDANFPALDLPNNERTSIVIVGKPAAPGGGSTGGAAPPLPPLFAVAPPTLALLPLPAGRRGVARTLATIAAMREAATSRAAGDGAATRAISAPATLSSTMTRAPDVRMMSFSIAPARPMTAPATPATCGGGVGWVGGWGGSVAVGSVSVPINPRQPPVT